MKREETRTPNKIDFIYRRVTQRALELNENELMKLYKTQLDEIARHVLDGEMSEKTQDILYSNIQALQDVIKQRGVV